MKYLLKYTKTTAFFAGAVTTAAFAPYYFLPAALAGFSCLLYLLLAAKSYKEAFVSGYVFGFAHFAFGFSWIGRALLIEPEKFGWLYPVVLAASGGFFGLFFALPAMMSFCGRSPWRKWVIFGAAAVVLEWVRSFLFTGFPWNLSGYMLAGSDEMIQAAAFGGTYLLSLLVLLGCSAGGLWLYDRRLKVLLPIVCGLVLTTGVLWGGGRLRLAVHQEEESGIWVRIVQPSIPQKMKWDKEARENNFQTYLKLSAADGENKPDIIVWGETASPFMLDVDEEHRSQAAGVIPAGGYLAAGMITYQPRDGWYVPHNSMVVLDDNGRVAAMYHKSHLVPFGEYIPFREYLPEFVRPVANAIGTFGRGAGPEKINLPGLPSFGGIICYEAIFPHQVVDENKRPDFLINLTNDGWYGNSAGPYQHWAAVRLRAVEEGITIVRAANNGISGVITAYGREKAVLPLNYAGFSDVQLNKTSAMPTFYSRTGNILILTFCLILLFLGSISRK